MKSPQASFGATSGVGRAIVFSPTMAMHGFCASASTKASVRYRTLGCPSRAKKAAKEYCQQDDWVAQLNLQHVLAPDEIQAQITRLQIVDLIRDWRFSEKRAGGLNYPPYQVHVVEIPIWGVERTRAYIEERVAIHQAAQAPGAALPECTFEERWEKPTKWAVVKTKESLKNHDTQEAAAQHAKRFGYRVELRLGEVTKCELYCMARTVCIQGKAAVVANHATSAANRAALGSE